MSDQPLRPAEPVFGAKGTPVELGETKSAGFDRLDRRSAPETKLPLIELSGSPRQRGQIHGETLREAIRAKIDLWREDIHADLRLHPDDYIRRLVADNDFITPAERWAPALVEEVRGMAEGAGVDFTTMFAHQLPDEDWWFRMETRYGPPGEACSSLGVYGQADSSTILAQNMDTPAYWDGFQVLLNIRDAKGLESFVFSVAGMLALCGMNSRGVGICCNTILQCNYARSGLPEEFVVRSVLACQSLAEAEALLRSIRHASPQNYLLGDAQTVIDLEISANQIAAFSPRAGAKVVYHTNHPLVNDDQSFSRARMNSLPPDVRAGMVRGSTTLDRYALLDRRLAAAPDPLTVEAIKSILREAPVCVAKQETRTTLGCAIMELAPLVQLNLSPGPPDVSEFTIYRFQERA